MTRNLRSQLADMAEQFIRLARGHVTRERAADLMSDWVLREPLDDELREEILARFPSAEPAAVAGLDFLPSQVDADAALIVASVDAEDLRIKPKTPREFTDAHGCTWRENGADWLTLLDANGKDSGLNKTPAFVEQCYGPLVEVTDEPTAVA